jgi:hypothetical protein
MIQDVYPGSRCFSIGSGRVADPDPNWIRIQSGQSVDPDPNSGSGSRRAEITHKSNFMF